MTTLDSQRIRILFDQRVPMRDGITLSADIYLPVGKTAQTAQWSVVLLRTPFLKADVHILERAHYFTLFGAGHWLYGKVGKYLADGFHEATQ